MKATNIVSSYGETSNCEARFHYVFKMNFEILLLYMYIVHGLEESLGYDATYASS